MSRPLAGTLDPDRLAVCQKQPCTAKDHDETGDSKCKKTWENW